MQAEHGTNKPTVTFAPASARPTDYYGGRWSACAPRQVCAGLPMRGYFSGLLELLHASQLQHFQSQQRSS